MPKIYFYLITLICLVLSSFLSLELEPNHPWQVHSAWINVSRAQPQLEIKRQAIRNGNLYASNTRLSYEQTKAIGWLKTSAGRFCTATVISDRAVLTAKHCFYGDQAPPRNSNFSFAILDDQSVENQSQDPLREPFIAEAEFSFRFADVMPLANLDIAMIRFVGQPFNRAGLQALPINAYPLEGSLKQNLTGSLVDVAGYGDTLHDNEDGRYFASVKLELITPTYIVTNGQNEQGICNGDSGGPLLASGVNGEVTILGVVTNGDECCVGLDQLTRVDLVANELITYGNAFSVPNTLYSENCWGISKDFQCRGNTLHLCLEGEAVSVDCATEQVCAFDSQDQRFDCVAKSEVDCPNVGSKGLCIDPSTLVRCEYGEERRITCVNSSCGVIAGGERSACISGEASLSICNPDNQSRLEWASEVVFEASNSCASHSKTSKNLLIMFGALFLILQVIRSKSRLKRY